jgi:hypothetical protein
VDIDLLSRTVYGEMASCNSHGGVYLDAVGKVILNRSDYAESEGMPAAMQFVDPKYKNVGEHFGQVILKDKQFSLWNKGDPAGKNAFCPENPKQKAISVGANGKPRTFGPAAEAYKKSVEVAVKAVLFPDQFRSEMTGVKQLFYTSSVEMHRTSGFVEHSNISTINGVISRKSCMRLWSSKRLAPKTKELFGLFVHPNVHPANEAISMRMTLPWSEK